MISELGTTSEIIAISQARGNGDLGQGWGGASGNNGLSLNLV